MQFQFQLLFYNFFDKFESHPKALKKKINLFSCTRLLSFFYNKILESTKNDCDKLVAIFLIIELVQLVFLSKCIVYIF